MSRDEISIKTSSDLGSYAAGDISVAQIRCVLCQVAPCGCPPFRTSEYFALIDRIHGKP